LNALVVGISADKQASQLKFIEKYGLTYPMVPNREKDVIAAYGAQAVLGLAAQRATFLIDPGGRIAHVWPKVGIKGHVDDVVATIRRLTGGP
jgi:thioredoxin-dependent peroxiredoxin